MKAGAATIALAVALGFVVVAGLGVVVVAFDVVVFLNDSAMMSDIGGAWKSSPKPELPVLLADAAVAGLLAASAAFWAALMSMEDEVADKNIHYLDLVLGFLRTHSPI